MMSTSSTHEKINPRIRNPVRTPNNLGSGNRKRNVVLDAAEIGNEKREMSGWFCAVEKTKK